MDPDRNAGGRLPQPRPPALERGPDGWPRARAEHTGARTLDEASTPRLLLLLGHALLWLGFNRLSLATRQKLVSALGLIALFCPLGLWVSWSAGALVFFLGLGVACVAGLLLIVWLSPEDEL